MVPIASLLEAAFDAQMALIGRQVGISGWMQIDQQKINRFAQATDDFQYIHINPEEAARRSPYGGVIAHGFLTLSLASRFSGEVLKPLPGQIAGVNYGLNRVRFVGPVRVNEFVRGRFRLLSVRKHPAGGLMRELEFIVDIRGREKPALVATWLILGLFET